MDGVGDAQTWRDKGLLRWAPLVSLTFPHIPGALGTRFLTSVKQDSQESPAVPSNMIHFTEIFP